MTLNFNLFDLHIDYGNWWVSLLSFDHDRCGSTSLLHIEYTNYRWKFDLLWLAPVVRKALEVK